MSNYDLAFTGGQIDSLLGSVDNAENSVVNSSNMIKSSAVFNSINSLGTSNFSSSALIESGESFPYASNTAIPTCAGLVSALGNQVVSSSIYHADGDYGSLLPSYRTSSGKYVISEASLNGYATGVTMSFDGSDTLRVEVTAGTKYSLNVNARIGFSSSDGVPEQQFDIRNNGVSLVGKSDSSSSSGVHYVDLNYNPQVIYNAVSDQTYLFDVYWTEGDSANSAILRFDVGFITYGNFTYQDIG